MNPMRGLMAAVLTAFFIGTATPNDPPDVKPVKPVAHGADPNAKPGKAPTIKELTEQLKDKSAQVRRMAVQQLGARGVQSLEAVPNMITALDDSEAAVRASAAEALGGIGVTAKSAVPALLKKLKDASPDVRESAAEALADIGVDAAKVVPALMELLSDGDMNVRCAAASSLGDFRGAARDAIPALEKIKKNDKHPFVREAAADALQTIHKSMQKLDS